MFRIYVHRETGEAVAAFVWDGEDTGDYVRAMTSLDESLGGACTAWEAMFRNAWAIGDGPGAIVHVLGGEDCSPAEFLREYEIDRGRESWVGFVVGPDRRVHWGHFGDCFAGATA